jgi:PAS domain S-box-containing protein
MEETRQTESGSKSLSDPQLGPDKPGENRSKGLLSGDLRHPWEQMLGGLEDRFSSFVSRALDGVIVIDQEGKILEWNQAEEQITGIARSEAVGQPLWEVQFRLTPDERKEPASLQAAKAKIFAGLNEGAGLRRVLEDEIQRPDGARRCVQSIIFGIPAGEGLLAGGICRDITERRQLETRLRESEVREGELRKSKAALEEYVRASERELEGQARELQRLARKFAEAADEERKRLSDVLHGDLQQQLAGVKFQLRLLCTGIDDDPLRKILERAQRMLEEAIEKSRNLSHDLLVPGLVAGDLAEACEWLAREMKAKYGLTVNLSCRGEVKAESQLVAAFLYRAAQELLFNVVKHACAKEADVRLRRWARRISLLVCDQGNGLDPQKVRYSTGYGLRSMRHRVHSLGGRIKMRSATGKGTVCLIVLPDPPPPGDEKLANS